MSPALEPDNVGARRSGQAPKAQAWITTGSIPTSAGLGCVDCHK